MSEHTPFFATEENRKILDEFITKCNNTNMPVRSPAYRHRIDASINISRFIYNKSELWDKYCLFSIQDIGKLFIIRIKDFQPDSEYIDPIYVLAYQFLYEYNFIAHEKDTKPSSEQLRILNNPYINELSEEYENQIKQTPHKIQVGVLKNLLRDFNKDRAESLQLTEKLRNEGESQKQELDNRISKVEELKNILEKQENAYNFVGLYKGFSNLAKQKYRERHFLFCTLIAAGIIITAIPSISYFSDIWENWNNKKIVSFISLVSLEAILIYFFRIILSNYKAVKAQIMQIELRMTLCRFIQRYAKYAETLTNKAALAKFENIIFSAISSDSENLPNPFDGINQMANLLKEMKNKP